ESPSRSRGRPATFEFGQYAGTLLVQGGIAEQDDGVLGPVDFEADVNGPTSESPEPQPPWMLMPAMGGLALARCRGEDVNPEAPRYTSGSTTASSSSSVHELNCTSRWTDQRSVCDTLCPGASVVRGPSVSSSRISALVKVSKVQPKSG